MFNLYANSFEFSEMFALQPFFSPMHILPYYTYSVYKCFKTFIWFGLQFGLVWFGLQFGQTSDSCVYYELFISITTYMMWPKKITAKETSILN